MTDKCAFPMFVYTLITKTIFFTLLHCFHTFVVGLCLGTFHRFRCLKYAAVYVTVPFQSASKLSFPSSVFSGVTPRENQVFHHLEI